jgi:hypothetical protein
MSKMLDLLSEYLARRKGLLPLVGIGLILLNLGLQVIAPDMWLATSNLCLHFGLIVAIVGFMLARAL